MRLARRLARKLGRNLRLLERRTAVWMIAGLRQQYRCADGNGDAPPDRLPFAWRLARALYFLKRYLQACLAGQIGPGTPPSPFWKQEIATSFVVRLHRAAHWPRAQRRSLYKSFARKNRLLPAEAEAMRQRAAEFQARPLISVIVPVYDGEPVWLERAVQSVLAQTYDRWELVLVDDASRSPATREALVRLAGWDDRIVLETLSRNGGVSRATNCGVALSHGEFLAFLDHDDELFPEALWWIVAALNERPDRDLLYTDEESVHEDGRREAHFKPDFSPELLTAYNYLCHLLVIRRTLFERLGGLRPCFDGAQDYDLVLRAIRATDRVSHLPRVLYRWHQIRRSASRELDPCTQLVRQRATIDPITQEVVQDHLDRLGLAATAHIVDSWVRPEFRPVDRGKVSVLIATRDHPWLLWRCVRSIESRTDYPNYELVIVDDESRQLASRLLVWWLGRRHRVLRVARPAGGDFDFARLVNFAAREVDGRFLLFLNDDTRVARPGWLSALVGYASIPGVGATGARLLLPGRRVQHAGIIIGAMGWGPWHAAAGRRADTRQFGGYASFPHNAIALTGACLLTPCDLFLRMGGFDADRFAVSFNDVDYCLRLHRAGYRMVYVPQAELWHDAGRSRGHTIDAREAVQLRHQTLGMLDPYWNPNCTRQSPGFQVDCRRRVRGLVQGRRPHVLVVGPVPRAGDPWPAWSELADELARRDQCTFQAIPIPTGSAMSQIDRAVEESLRHGDFDVLVAQGQEAFGAIERAASLRIPSIWYLPNQLLMPSNASGKDHCEYLRILSTLSLPYQVVFPNVLAAGWAGAGLPRDNMTVLEAVPGVVPLPSEVWAQDTLRERGRGGGRHVLNGRGRSMIPVRPSLTQGVPPTALGPVAKATAPATDPTGSRPSLRAAFGIGSNHIACLAIGPAYEPEGLAVINEGYRRLGSRLRRTSFLWIVLVGADGADGPSAPFEENGGPARDVAILRWLGPGHSISVTSPLGRHEFELADLYRAADVFLAHATSDARPWYVLEALRVGLPVIGTTQLALAELIHVGGNGLVFRPYRPRQLTRALRFLLDHPHDRQRFAEQSVHWLASRADAERVHAEWAALIREAAELHPRSARRVAKTTQATEPDSGGAPLLENHGTAAGSGTDDEA